MGVIESPLIVFGGMAALCLALVCFLASKGELNPPEWLFPVKGRWLRRLFAGVGTLCLIVSAPIWFCPGLAIAAMIALGLLTEAVLNRITPRTCSPGRAGGRATMEQEQPPHE